MILVPANKVEKNKYFSTLLGLIFIEITRGPLEYLSYHYHIQTNLDLSKALFVSPWFR